MKTETQKPCADCGEQTPYEPIIIMGVDFLAKVDHLCESCQAKRRAEMAEKEKAEKIANAKARYEATVPPRMLDTDVSHPDYNLAAHKAVHAAQALDWRRNILLFGAAGLCKSRILARLCARAAWEGHSVGWITAHEFALLADRYKSFKTRVNAQEEIERLKRVPRLVFDDLGKQDWTPKIEEVFFAVVDFRVNHYLPTWFSANTHPQQMLDEGQFTKDRGASIVGRILEGAHEFEFKS